MTGPKRGFALLCSRMGDPNRKVLTTAQFRNLTHRMRAARIPSEDRDLTSADLMAIGYGRQEAAHIVGLLSEEDRLDWYLNKAEKAGCGLITLFSHHYPRALEQRLGTDAPALLWYRGDLSVLEGPRIGLVGSRDLFPENEAFARQAGAQATRQGFTLVSGNARGADRTGQNAALASGGRVISVVADQLDRHYPREGMLYLSEDSFDLEFSAHRALSRNRLIHSLGTATLVAQTRLKQGGTWDGSVKNLRFGWSPLYCFDDGSAGSRMLAQMGASLIRMEQLEHLASLSPGQTTLY